MSTVTHKTYPAGHSVVQVEADGGRGWWEVRIPGEPRLVFGRREAAEFYADQVQKETRQAAAGTRIGSS